MLIKLTSKVSAKLPVVVVASEIIKEQVVTEEAEVAEVAEEI